MPLSQAHVRAFAVHVFTACGAALGLLALLAAARGAWPAMFVWLGAALVVDGIDGSLARRYAVDHLLPRWDGNVLDMVVDFTTYVFVPAFALATCGLLPAMANVAVPLLITVSAAIYFADRQMKLPGHFFRGFPALWNAAAFYLFVLKPPPWIAAVVLTALVVLTFAPFRFVHPVRVERLRVLNIVLVIAWSLLALLAVLDGLDPPLWAAAGLSVIGIYFLVFGLLVSSRAGLD